MQNEYFYVHAHPSIVQLYEIYIALINRPYLEFDFQIYRNQIHQYLQLNENWDKELDQPLLLQLVLDEKMQKPVEPQEAPKDLLNWVIKKLEIGFKFKDVDIQTLVNDFQMVNESYDFINNQKGQIYKAFKILYANLELIDKKLPADRPVLSTNKFYMVNEQNNKEDLGNCNSLSPFPPQTHFLLLDDACPRGAILGGDCLRVPGRADARHPTN